MADTGEINNDYLPEPTLGVFTLEIAAPGGSSASWRPFPTQELPLAEYASRIIERFEFKAEVIELTADRDPDASRPGLILIDPRFMTTPGGAGRTCSGNGATARMDTADAHRREARRLRHRDSSQPG